jgi:hypothetical protein
MYWKTHGDAIGKSKNGVLYRPNPRAKEPASRPFFDLFSDEEMASFPWVHDSAEFLADCCHFRFRESLTAFLAELRPKMVCPTATGAGNFKPRPTILAEDGIGGILSPALGAVHNITQLALKSFKLLGREKRCRT